MAKKAVIETIFTLCSKKNDFVFDNNLVKEILRESDGDSGTNPYDMTKIDDLSKLPETVLRAGYVLIHLGDGRHKFIKGVDKIYHPLENIE